jgi:hypothetical protein
VHGDIRLSNIVFNGEESTLIDFDFSGKEDEAQYPEGFNVIIHDGARHANAKGGANLAKVHDLFALSEVMRLFSSDTLVWDTVIWNVERGLFVEALSILQHGWNEELRCRDHSLENSLKKRD